MATPGFDPDTEDLVYHVHPDYDDSYDPDDSDMQTISSASTSRTTSTITSDEINGKLSHDILSLHHITYKLLIFFQNTFVKCTVVCSLLIRTCP